VRAVPAAQKLSTIEERRHDKSCVSKKKIQKQKPERRKPILCSSPGEDGFCTSKTNHDRTGPKPKLYFSAGILQEKKPQTRENVLGSSLGEGGFFSSATNSIEAGNPTQSIAK
jgi:hypothetical protein